MTSRFQVDAALEVTGRGRVIAGDILAGLIRVGMYAVSPTDPATRWRIIGVEFLDSPSRGESHVGLLVADAPVVDMLREQLPRGTVLDVVA